jgi:hypothetical protein
MRLLQETLLCGRVRKVNGFVPHRSVDGHVRVDCKMRKTRFRSEVSILVAAFLLLALVTPVVAEPRNGAASTTQNSASGSYLLLLTFYAGPLKDFSTNEIDGLNASPYQGVAIPLLGQYETGTYNKADYDAAVVRFTSKTSVDLWPWVYANRFYGFDPKGITRSNLAKSQYFQNIKGFDIYDKAGALSDFYGIFTGALNIAKSTGSPGIVLDLETYNDYSIVKIDQLSRVLGQREGDVATRLREIGSKLMDIVNAQYPSAVILLPVTGLTRVNGATYVSSFSYIVDGMLRRAKDLNSKATIVAGGEYTLGYCELSLSGLKSTIQTRNQAYAPLLRKYPNLKLGGTIAPWLSEASKTGWMRDYHNCPDSTIKNLADFTPLVNELLSSYRYVWIYAAGVGGYNPLKYPHQELHLDR